LGLSGDRYLEGDTAVKLALIIRAEKVEEHLEERAEDLAIRIRNQVVEGLQGK
jgi:hypothetical protein